MTADYQISEFGPIPADWSVATLGDLGKCIRGVSYKPDNLLRETGDGVTTLLRSNNIRHDAVNFDEVQFVAGCKISNDQLARPFDVAICMSNGSKALVGKSGVITSTHLTRYPKLTVGAFCAIYRSSVYYTAQIFKSHFFQLAIDVQLAGSAINNLKGSDVEGIRFPLPPLPEQQKIAAILTAVDDKLDVIARQIEATQTLKRGLMQTLFSRGVGTQDAHGRWVPHTEFRCIAGRILPCSWEGATLSAYIAELRSGVSVNAEDRPCEAGEIGVLKVSSVQGGKFVPTNHKAVVPGEISRVAEPVQKDSIIISRANTPALVGESAYIADPWPNLFLPDKLWKIQPTTKAHSTRWLAFYLQSPEIRQEVRKTATGTSGSMKNISKISLLSIFMPLVPLEEQRHIADLLTSVTSKVEALEAKHRHYQTLKRGLMQKLLTGQWRVKPDNPGTPSPVAEAA